MVFLCKNLDLLEKMIYHKSMKFKLFKNKTIFNRFYIKFFYLLFIQGRLENKKPFKKTPLVQTYF